MPGTLHTRPYCRVRFSAGYHRTTSRKIFYSETLLLSTFIDEMRKHGEIHHVDFPVTPRPVTDEELQTARAEGRVL